MFVCLLLQVQAVIKSLNSVLLEKQASTEEEWTRLGMPSSGNIFMLKNFPKLVEQLKAQKNLPALVFRYNILHKVSGKGIFVQ